MLKKILPSLFLLFFVMSAVDAANTPQECSSKNVELWTKATYATSGSDLVILGKRVRLIGLYSPQREKKQKFNTPAQPLAKEAQLFLNKLLANNDLEVGVEYDTTKIDEGGRQLVHLYLKDGTSVQQKILESGFAINRPGHNNHKYAKCYFKAEQTAREGPFQLWDYLAKHPDSHFPLVKSSELTSQDTGYRIIQGKILKVMKSSTNIIINMDTTGIRIPKKHWDKFDYNKIKQLKGKTIEVRGLAYLYKGVMFVIIKQPAAIDAFNPLNTP
jgi:endonuclease YncB( thermonuclease family)